MREAGGEPGAFFLPDWLPLWAEHLISGRHSAAEKLSDASASRTSPWKETRDKYAALNEQLSYEKKRGALVPIDDVRLIYARAAAVIRPAMQGLCSQCGPPIDTALDDAQDLIEKEFAQRGEGDPSAELQEAPEEPRPRKRASRGKRSGGAGS